MKTRTISLHFEESGGRYGGYFKADVNGEPDDYFWEQKAVLLDLDYVVGYRRPIHSPRLAAIIRDWHTQGRPTERDCKWEEEDTGFPTLLEMQRAISDSTHPASKP